MEVRASHHHIAISPQKLRLVCDKVRGMDAQPALTVLEYMPQKGSDVVFKVLQAAIANAENNFDLNANDLYISQIYAGEGPRGKRFKAGARGRYKPRVKRYSHIWVFLKEREED